MPADYDALNYPYIRIEDVNWLKRTLLIFPHVVRIAPEFGGPTDDPDVATFCKLRGRRGPLLRSARLRDPHILEVQYQLIQEIQKMLDADDPRLRRLYKRMESIRYVDQQATWNDRFARRSFQLHRSKMMYELSHFLRDNGLAWTPQRSHGENYVETDQYLGEAIMATLAYACASNEVMHLVTEFPYLFSQTLEKPEGSILEACLPPFKNTRPRPRRSVAEFIVHQRCDPALLTPERIQALSMEWEAMGAFKEAIERAAETIPLEIHEPVILERRLHDLANDIFKEWIENKANMSNYVKCIFGSGFLAEPEKLIEKLVYEALGSSAASAIIGGLTTHYFLGAAAGCAIGVVYKGFGAARALRNKSNVGPLRYLTALEKAGVSFAISR